METLTTRAPLGTSPPENADTQNRLLATFSTCARIVSGLSLPKVYRAPKSSRVHEGTRKLLTISNAADPVSIRLQLRFRPLILRTSQLKYTRSVAPGIVEALFPSVVGSCVNCSLGSMKLAERIAWRLRTRSPAKLISRPLLICRPSWIKVGGFVTALSTPFAWLMRYRANVPSHALKSALAPNSI